MGSAVGCLKKSKTNENPLLKDKIVLSVRSTQFNHDSSASTILSLNQHVPSNFKMEFNWSQMQTIYLGCPSSLNDDLNLTLPMVYAVEKVFEVVERDLILNAKKIQFCVTFLGKNFCNKFRASAEHSDNDIKYRDIDDQLLAHIISYIKFHKMLLCTFECNINEARRCLNLLAHSHSAMNVTQTDFRMFDIAVEKFLLKFNIVDEENLKIAVSYFNLITNYICNYIYKHNSKQTSVNEMIYLDNMLKPRESSTQTRKWNRLIGRLRYDTCPYIEEALELNSTKKEQPNTSTTKYHEMCPLSNIDYLFRNNKN